MTDEFNLVPTNNLEKHLDNILRAASGEEPQYDLAPNWRIEQYLAAIVAKLSEGGGVLVVHDVDGTLDKTWQEIHDAMLVGGAALWTSEADIDSIASARYIREDNTYIINIIRGEGSVRYTADAADGYPEEG